MTQQVFIGADHGGFTAKTALISQLTQAGYSVIDCGAPDLKPDDDYPVYAQAVAQAVAAHPDSSGILLCRTGAGMCIAANKQHGVRAVCAQNIPQAVLAREHNHANILAIGADEMPQAQMWPVVEAFLTAAPSQEERHVRRVQQITSLE